MTAEPQSPDHRYQLTGRTVIVTGAGRGIGRACALWFAAAGANVVLAARTRTELDVVAQEAESLGVRALVVACDVSNYAACQELADQAIASFGRIDVLINNAGMGAPKPLADEDPAVWAQTISLNVVGPFNTSHVVIPHMRAVGGGRIIMIGSGQGHANVVEYSAYGSSKAALSYLTRTMSMELWSDGIDVNEVIPGPVLTALTEQIVVLDQAPPGLPSERVKMPEDVADLVGWIVGQRVGGPTGQVFSLARRPL